MTSPPLLALEAALDSLLAAAVPPRETQSLGLDAALGRVLAQDVHALIDVPPADNSAMDGYALRCVDAGTTVPVSQRVAAGDWPQPLSAGTAARVFTGAAIPEGAEAVVLQEDCDRRGDHVRLPPDVTPGQHIRRRAQDCARGDLLLGAGRRLRPQDLGLLASQGVAGVEVFRPLTVALLSTGSELREAGDGALSPGQIFNSNRPMLAALLRALGCAVDDLGIIRDTPEATAAALTTGARSDLVLSTGGVSVGEADLVREQVAALGAIDLWRVAIKPGKPFAFGRVGDTPFIGLPGNPVSAFVTFLLLARPFICALQGRLAQPPARYPARADFTAPAGGRTEFLRARVSLQDGELWVTPLADQSSGVLSSVSASTVLAVAPRGQALERGDRVDVLPLDELLY